MERRSFIDGFLWTSVTALAGAIFYPILRFISPPRIPESTTARVLAGKVSQMPKEGWTLFPFGSQPGILIQVAPGEFRAFSATCTHLDCTVQYDDDSRRIWCACHNGWYNLAGENVAGPPPKPLEPYEVQVIDDDIFVSLG